MLALVIFLFAFTSNRNLQRKIIKTEVIFVENDADFISKKTVNKLLIENKMDVRSIGLKFEQIGKFHQQ
jgi:cell division protein FtsQ